MRTMLSDTLEVPTRVTVGMNPVAPGWPCFGALRTLEPWKFQLRGHWRTLLRGTVGLNQRKFSSLNFLWFELCGPGGPYLGQSRLESYGPWRTLLRNTVVWNLRTLQEPALAWTLYRFLLRSRGGREPSGPWRTPCLEYTVVLNPVATIF